MEKQMVMNDNVLDGSSDDSLERENEREDENEKSDNDKKKERREGELHGRKRRVKMKTRTSSPIAIPSARATKHTHDEIIGETNSHHQESIRPKSLPKSPLPCDLPDSRMIFKSLYAPPTSLPNSPLRSSSSPFNKDKDAKDTNQVHAREEISSPPQNEDPITDENAAQAKPDCFDAVEMANKSVQYPNPVQKRDTTQVQNEVQNEEEKEKEKEKEEEKELRRKDLPPSTSRSSSSSSSSSPSMIQCEIQEDIVMKMVEKIINDKMDTIRMMVESCVNKKLKDYRKLANNSYKAHTRQFSQFNPIHQQQSQNNQDTQNDMIASSSHTLFSSSLLPPCKSQSLSLLNFGTENIQYLLMPYLSDLIKSMSEMRSVFQVVLKDLFLNPDHKENNNIFIPPNAFKTMSVYVDDIWKNYDLDVSLQNIIQRVNDVLQYYIIGSQEEDKFRAEIGKKKFDLLQSFTNQIDTMEDHPEFLSNLMQHAEHTIVTNQHLVHKNIIQSESGK